MNPYHNIEVFLIITV